jgi:hypothetical protein
MKFSNQHKKIAAFLFLISFGMMNAQENITYEQALEKAFQQNGTLKNSRLVSEYQEKLKASYLDIPKQKSVHKSGKSMVLKLIIRSPFPNVSVFRRFILKENKCWMRNGMRVLSTKV